GESEDGPFLVLEHLAGGSLRDMLDQGTRLSASQALLVGLEAARALDYAHRRDLVHRDVKPANLLFDDEGRVCIADFGLARALAEAAWTEPLDTMLGTARYASPEQVQGRSVNGKADVYALALLMVEAVTGTVPFSADTKIATLMGRVGARLEVPPELGAIGPVVQEAAAPEVADRLDAGALARALEEIARRLPAPDPFRLAPRSATAAQIPDDRAQTDLTELGVGAGGAGRDRPDPPTVSLAVPVPTGRQEPADEPPTAMSMAMSPTTAPADDAPFVLASGRRRRRRWPWVALVVVLAAMGAGTGFAVVRLRVPEHPVPSLAGRTLDQARAEVADEKFKLRETGRVNSDTVPAGTIIDQVPARGNLREGKTIGVVISAGLPPREVPDLTGLDQTAAVAALAAADLVAVVTRGRNEDVPLDIVINWAPTGTVTKNAEISINVSDGAPLREVPDLSGRSFEDAKALLAERGLVAKRSEVFSNDVDAGVVVRTQPVAGAPAEKGSPVTVVVSK
ncbi:MAG: PASTA domain-containing protein, partial [Acidimicrobiales bacterium]